MCNKFLVIYFILIYLSFSCAFYRIGKKGLQPAYFRKEFPYGRLKTQVAITDELKKLVEVENALLEEEYGIGEAQVNRNKLNYQCRNYDKYEINSQDSNKNFDSSKHRFVDERGRKNIVNPINSKFIVEKDIRDSNIKSNKHMVSTSEKSKLSLFQLLVVLGTGTRPSESNSERGTLLLQMGKLKDIKPESDYKINIPQNTGRKLNIYKTFNLRPVSRLLEQNTEKNRNREGNLRTKELKKNTVERDVPAEGPYGLEENGLV